MFFRKDKRKFLAFTLSEMLVALAVVSVIASIVVPMLKSAVPSTKRVMLRKAYSTAEKAIFRVLSLKNSDKTLIFSLDDALMDTSVVDNDYKNKFCYYFKEQLNTLDISGVDCPASTVTSPTPVHFAKTTDGVDWYISPVPFTDVDTDEVQKITNEQMEDYANEKATEAVAANASLIEAKANKAWSDAYAEAEKNPTEVVNENNSVNIDRCESAVECHCDETQTKYYYYEITQEKIYADVTSSDGTVEKKLVDLKYNRKQVSRDEAIDALKTNYGISDTEFDNVCGSGIGNYCQTTYCPDDFELNYENRSSDVYPRPVTIVLVPYKKTYTFAYSFTLLSVAYPDFNSSSYPPTSSDEHGYVRDKVTLSDSFNTYSSASNKSCPPCTAINAAAKKDSKNDTKFCEYPMVRKSVNYAILAFKKEIAYYILGLKSKADENNDIAKKAYADEAKKKAIDSETYRIRIAAYKKALNDTAKREELYNENLSLASGSGSAKKDFPLKIIVDVNGVSNQPNCSADTSAYGASYMPNGYSNVNCSDPDTFILGIRYDGKIRAANSATSYSSTAYTDSIAKEYLSNFVHH